MRKYGILHVHKFALAEDLFSKRDDLKNHLIGEVSLLLLALDRPLFLICECLVGMAVYVALSPE